MSGKKSKAPLIFSTIEELRRKGYNQSEIAEMHGVTRQAVSWQKLNYGGRLTPRQIVNKAWPWKTTDLHGKSKAFQRLRDHGEYMATGGRGMNEDKMTRLRAWWKKLRDENLVLEFDPKIPPIKGVSPHGGFAYRQRVKADHDLLIRLNEHTNITEEGMMIWRFPEGEV
jgi:hypothetical protein